MLDGLKQRFSAALRAFRGNQPTMANWALDAARYDDAYGHTPMPLRANDEWDAFDLLTTYQRARALYENCAPIRSAVDQIVRYIGVLSPLPDTDDDEWNKLAAEAWCRRTSNPHLFDLAGRVNYQQAITFCELCAIVDGDVLVVPTRAADGGASFAFYRAPQITGGGVYGVDTNKHGRATGYFVEQDDGKIIRIPAAQAVLYQHAPDPTRYRGHTRLAAAIRNGKDLLTIVGYTKQGIKIAASMGLVATKSNKNSGFNMAANFGNAGNAKGANKEDPGIPHRVPKSELGTGLNITQLPEDWDIKTISDTRPSQQLQTFLQFIIRSIAQGVSLDPEVLFNSNELTASASRFVLEKLSRFQEVNHRDQRVLDNRLWVPVIACEIAEGRLPACKDPKWMTPRWVPQRDMTIDASRVAQAHLNLVREGAADNEDYCLRTTGMTPQQLARRKAAYLADQKAIAAEYGLTLAELFPQQVGSVPQPGSDAAPEDATDDAPGSRKENQP